MVAPTTELSFLHTPFELSYELQESSREVIRCGPAFMLGIESKMNGNSSEPLACVSGSYFNAQLLTAERIA